MNDNPINGKWELTEEINSDGQILGIYRQVIMDNRVRGIVETKLTNYKVEHTKLIEIYESLVDAYGLLKEVNANVLKDAIGIISKEIDRFEIEISRLKTQLKHDDESKLRAVNDSSK